MKIIDKYILNGFLVTFLITLTVITFIMSLGGLFKITTVLAKGGTFSAVAPIFGYAVIQTLVYSIPISSLIASLLIFGRFSADGEITAMRTSGIGIFEIIKLPVITAFILMIICWYIANQITPAGRYILRSTIADLRNISLVNLFEEGRFVEGFGNLTIFINSKNGNRIEKIHIIDKSNPGFIRDIKASYGVITTNGNDLIIELYNGRIDPFDDDKPGAAYFSKFPLVLKDALKKREYRKQQKDFFLSELIYAIYNPASVVTKEASNENLQIAKTSFLVELNKRIVLSLSCLIFVVLGIPLGIRSHRKESSIGIAISLIILTIFYLFIILSESLNNKPHLHPDLIMWVPVLIALFISSTLLRKQR